MKSHVSPESVLTNAQMLELKAKMKELADSEFQKLNRQATRRLLQLATIVLNREFGFGRKRLLDFLGSLNELVAVQYNDPVFWDHVDIRCEQMGVDDAFR